MSEFDKMLENYIQNELTKPDQRLQANYITQTTVPTNNPQNCGSYQVKRIKKTVEKLWLHRCWWQFWPFMSPKTEKLYQYKDAVTHMLSPTLLLPKLSFRVFFIKKNLVTIKQIRIQTTMLRSTQIKPSQQDQYIHNVILVKIKLAISIFIKSINNKMIFIAIISIQLTRPRTNYRATKLFMIWWALKDQL